jgi:hypothetical protein
MTLARTHITVATAALIAPGLPPVFVDLQQSLVTRNSRLRTRRHSAPVAAVAFHVRSTARWMTGHAAGRSSQRFRCNWRPWGGASPTPLWLER